MSSLPPLPGTERPARPPGTRLALRWRMAARCLFAAGVLVVMFAGVRWVESGFVPGEVVLPKRNILELPIELGQWRGEDTHWDTQLSKGIETDITTNRLYRDGPRQVGLHAATWMDKGFTIPHPPDVCYEGMGWTIVGSRDVSLPAVGDLPATARLLTAEQNGERVYGLYWYQLGKARFPDADGMRIARRELWGQPTWPPLTKVLLQAHSASSAELALLQLEPLAGEIIVWMDADESESPAGGQTPTESGHAGGD